MSFQPVIPLGGMAGWAFLQRTQEAQKAAFEKSPAVQRDTDYFRAQIGTIDTAEELVSDYRLLKVALGAFGLDDDIGNKAFIEKVLGEGTLNPDAFAHKLADKRYLEFSKAFGFGDFATPRSQISDFPDKIITAFNDRRFEIAVGAQREEMRFSLGLERELAAITGKDTSADGMWFSVMGNPPLRRVFETALGLPTGFAALDLDQQLVQFRDKAKAAFGDGEVAQFSDPEKREELNRLFLVKSEVNQLGAGLSPGAIVLTLLQNIG